MKKSVLLIILILSSLFCVFGQNSPIDLILLLDTSSGMASSYETVSDYITGSLLSEYLRLGDTFHLITFSGAPKLDIARRIESVGDVETIVGRMLIQYPVESGNDAAAAIRYAEDYAASLPLRPKKIVMIGTGASDINTLISAARQRLSSGNASLDFVLVTPGQPLANLPSSGRVPVVTAAAPSTQSPATQTQSQTPSSPGVSIPAQTPSTTVQTPAPSAAATPAQTPPTTAQTQAPSVSATPAQTPPPIVSQTPPESSPQTPSQETRTEPSSAVQPDTGVSGTDVESASSLITETQTGAPASQPGEIAGTSGIQQQAPISGEPESANNFQTATVTPNPETKGASALPSSLPLIIGIIILALLIIGLIIFFASRRLGSSPNRVMASVSSSKTEKQEKEEQPTVNRSKELSSYAAGQNKQRTTPYADRRPVKTENTAAPVINPQGPLLLNLFVEDQNTAIGKRNIHSLKSGYSLTVGGGKSDFLIFLVPVPQNIGEIHRNGSQCSFIPRKPKYFPDLGSNELRDCINKTIRIISDKNYELRFRFEMYEDPLEALNKMLHSVKVPG